MKLANYLYNVLSSMSKLTFEFSPSLWYLDSVSGDLTSSLCHTFTAPPLPILAPRYMKPDVFDGLGPVLKYF